jgi:hypothetical protein
LCLWLNVQDIKRFDCHIRSFFIVGTTNVRNFKMLKREEIFEKQILKNSFHYIRAENLILQS